MTPEERAIALADVYCLQEWNESSLRRDRFVLDVADTIRAAENDALERAAEKLDESYYEDAAELIRVLKHPEPQ